MTLFALAANALLLFVDAAVLVALGRRPSLRRFAAGFAVILVACVGVGCTGYLHFESNRWGGAIFPALALLSFGLFLHLPATLLVGALRFRAARPHLAAAAGVAALLVLAVGADAFLLEPTRLQVRRYTLRSEKLTRPYRLVLVADIQTDRVGAYERRVLESAMAERPDLILLAGDYVHTLEPEPYREALAALNALFREVGLAAPLGVVAVEGNCEHPIWPRLFEGLAATTCVERTRLRAGELSVTALSFEEGFDPDLVVEREPGFHIVLAHAPDFALGAVDADLLLAGHTHGGQVVLPFFGPPVTLSRVPRAWAGGRTELPEQPGLSAQRTLIVSRGIGMERGYAPRLRFLCPPEVVVIELLPLDAASPEEIDPERHE